MPNTLSFLQGGGAKKVLILAKRGGLAISEFFFLKGGWGGGVSKIGGSGILGGRGAEDFLKVIFNC